MARRGLRLDHAIFLAALVRLAKVHKRPIFASEIAEEMSLEPATVRSLLNYFRERNLVAMVDRSRPGPNRRLQTRYQATPKAEAASLGANKCAGCGGPPEVDFRGLPWCRICLTGAKNDEAQLKEQREQYTFISCALGWSDDAF